MGVAYIQHKLKIRDLDHFVLDVAQFVVNDV